MRPLSSAPIFFSSRRTSVRLASSTLLLWRSSRRWADLPFFGSSNREAKISLQRRIAGRRTPSAVQARDSWLRAISIELVRVCWAVSSAIFWSTEIVLRSVGPSLPPVSQALMHSWWWPRLPA